MRRATLENARCLLSKRSVVATVVVRLERSEKSIIDSLSSCQLSKHLTRHSNPTRVSKEIRRLFSSSSSSHLSSLSATREDFFGEHVTFLEAQSDDTDSAMAAYNTFLVAVLTKGKSMTGGGYEEGLQIKAAHATAIAWSGLLECTAHDAAPMMAVVAVGPIMVQADVTYLCRVDKLLQSTAGKIQLMDIANKAIYHKDNADLTQRERHHLQALDLLMQHRRHEALKMYLELLRRCPGDILALSFTIDLAATLGDKRAALRAATTVYSYWQDRQRVMAGYSIGASLIAVGLAAGGRFDIAEGFLRKSVPHVDLEGCGGIASWAFALVYDAEGRTAEGISALNGYDGVKTFESAGLLFFESRLCGYGARFALDREGERSGRSICRVYDESYTRIWLDSGYAYRKPLATTEKRVPIHMSRMSLKPGNSFFQSFFGTDKDESTQKDGQPDGTALPTTVDTLTWLPPTPQLLTDATFLLLRLTLQGCIDSDDDRWIKLANSWLTLLDQYEGDYSSLPESVRVASALVCHSIAELRFEEESSAITGARQLGKLMWLGTSKPATPASPEEWKKAVLKLSDSLVENFWDIDARPLFEVGVCHAACMSTNDLECLCIARSICSSGVALRANSPEEWSRYSKVLECLGDDVAADAAKSASLSMGAGQGGYGSH